MAEAATSFGLRVVDGRRLEQPMRDALRPGAHLCDGEGRSRQLPRYFYEIPTWEAARQTRLTEHFYLWEFIHTDVREAPQLRGFPRYVPCALPLLAASLEQFREAVGTYVHIAANGGYRSPRHQLTCNASTHSWGTAANIYRIGDTWLDTRDAIARYADIARETMPGVWTRPYGEGSDQSDDHLHIDLGYVVAVPHDVPGDTFNPKLDDDPL